MVQALENAGITVTKENLEVVDQLIKNQMPIDKDTLQKVIPYTKQYDGSHIDELLFLVKNKLPVTKDHLEHLHKMLLGDNKIIQNLASLSDDLSTYVKEAGGQEIAKLILKDSVLSQGVCKQSQKQVDGEVTPPETASERPLPLKAVMMEGELLLLENEINETLKPLMGKKITGLSEGSIQELFQQMEDLELPIALKEQLTEVLSKRIMSALFKREMLMNSSHLESPEKLTEFYQNIQDKVSNLLTLESQLPDSKVGELAKEAQGVKSSIEFMGDLNQRYNFIQLPMLLGDRLTHAELYVFNDKKQIKNDKASITALIRLDLVNLGHLDIYVNKKEQNISVQFYTENDEKNGLIEPKLFAIHNQLTKEGFKVQNITTKKKEKDFDVKDDFLQKKQDIHEVKRYTFDMRA